MLVIDASAAVDLCLSVEGFATLTDPDLHAPPLIHSESPAALHEMRWRGEVPEEMTALGLRRRRCWPIAVEEPADRGTRRLGFVVTPAEL